MVDVMTKEDELKFTEALRQLADRAQSEVGYSASRFRQMLAEHGGFSTATNFLGRKEPSEGFTNMHLAERVNLTMECLVQSAEWRRFFSDEQLRHAKSLTGNTTC